MAERRLPSGQGPGRAASGARPSQRRPARSAVRADVTARRGGPGPARSGGQSIASEQHRAEVRRPAGPARRVVAPRTADRSARRRRSGRAATVGVLVVAFVLAYAFPARVYLGQEAEINQLQTSQAVQRQRIADLDAKIARWSDPAFVITQARSRLQLVRRGELIYVVEATPPATAPATPPPSRPWFGQLWSTIQAADHPDGP